MKSNRFALLAVFAGATVFAVTGCGSSTHAVNPTSNLDTTPPAAPTNVRGTYDTAASRDYLNWDLSTSADVASYEVWKYSSDPALGGAGQLIASPDASTNNLPLANSGDPNTYYRVRAVDAAGNISAFSSTADVQPHTWTGGHVDPGNDPGGHQGIGE